MNATGDIRVGIVEDHPILVELLSASLNSIGGIQVVATAHGVGEAKKWFKPADLDVVILDIELPDGNGVGLGVSWRTEFPNLAIVLLSDLDMMDVVVDLPTPIKSGFSYLTKGATQSVETLAKVIRLAAAGEIVIDPNLLDRTRAKSGSRLSELTNRQFEILRLVARGESNQGIAEALSINVNSVGNHLIGIYNTLGVPEGKNSRVAAVLQFLADTTSSRGLQKIRV
jgi:DNA-binding NarL/FixJ family response regulator